LEENTIRIATILGCRPEIIRLSQIIPKLDKACDHILINTRQNFDLNMNDIFFSEFGIRKPDYEFDNHSQGFFWLGEAMTDLATVLEKEKPDRVLFLGDTYSSLASAYVAARLNIPIYHMEAGNRSHDSRMPEELNRRTIDHLSNVHLPYTQNSKANLLSEGIEQRFIFVAGNPIVEVLVKHKSLSDILEREKLKPQEYFILTAHRNENVNNPVRLFGIIDGCRKVSAYFEYPILMSCHPNTAKQVVKSTFSSAGISFREPFGFNDFMELERNALAILTDSGTVQEEACLLGVPCVTIRDNTERPETLECGANILSGVDSDSILRCVKRVLPSRIWHLPQDYQIKNTSDIVTNIIVGY
jgi:UDP-N-acetylglucosamine 2-epimerase (non-hydrolysing)